MKKWIALLLAASLSLSLAVPALAVEPEEEEQPVIISAPAEEYEKTDYDRGWDDGYDKGEAEGRAKGEADRLQGLPNSAPEYVYQDYEDTYEGGYAQGYQDGLNSGYENGFYAEFTKGYDEAYDEAYQKGYDAGADDARAGTPVEAPSREFDNSRVTYEQGREDGQTDGFENGYYDGYYDTCGRDLYQDLEIAALGGAPGQINVMWKGACVKFDVAPQVRDQRTMVPVRAVMESMGADVAYDAGSQTVAIQLGGADVTFAIGSDQYTIVKDGASETRKMDTAAYADSGRTMVPVRFLAEASGYTVLWDQDYKTVVILDEAAKIAEIDSKFTAINAILAARIQEQLGKKYQQTTDIKGSFTVYDDAGKATACPFSGKATSYTDGVAARVDISLNVRDALMALARSGSSLGDAQVSLRTILTTDWSDLTVSLLMDPEGKIYLNFPLLAGLSPELYEGRDSNAWILLGDLGSLTSLSTSMMGGAIPDMETPSFNLAQLKEEGFTIGRLAVMFGMQAGSPVKAEETLDMAVSLLEAIFGDSHVQKSGDRCTWTMDLGTLLSALPIEMDPADLEEISGVMDFGMTFSMDLKGAYDIDASLNLNLGEDAALTGSLKASGSDMDGKLTLKAAMDGTFGLELNVTQTSRLVNSLPDLTLPQGAQVIDLFGED